MDDSDSRCFSGSDASLHDEYRKLSEKECESEAKQPVKSPDLRRETAFSDVNPCDSPKVSLEVWDLVMENWEVWL